MKALGQRLKIRDKDRDKVDFAAEPVGQLFRKMFIPTLMGMVSIVILNLADGAFVGHGAGSDALAAINIAAPLFNLIGGIGILFGIGCSVVSSILLAKDNVTAARINVTQALGGSFFCSLAIGIVILANLDGTVRLFGASEAIVPLAGDYLKWVAAFMPLHMLGCVGSFVVRLDGSPRYAMCCTLVAALLNIILDWVFVFPLGMGLEGAAIATSISFIVSATLVLFYLLRLSRTLHLYRLKLSYTSFVLTLRNLWSQTKAGFPGMLGEIAICGIIIVGNYMFVGLLGDDGVAAFSVACYCMPIIYMAANAIVEASQPIISFAHGMDDAARLRNAVGLAVKNGLISGVLFTAIMSLDVSAVTLIFLDRDNAAYRLCVEGLPWFATGGIFISLNIVLTGFLQSIERSRAATVFTFLRGVVIAVPCFILLPHFIGVTGLWVAVPVAELLTFIGLCIYLRKV